MTPAELDSLDREIAELLEPLSTLTEKVQLDSPLECWIGRQKWEQNGYGYLFKWVPIQFTRSPAAAFRLLGMMPDMEFWRESHRDADPLYGCVPDMDIDTICSFDAVPSVCIALAFLAWAKTLSKEELEKLR